MSETEPTKLPLKEFFLGFIFVIVVGAGVIIFGKKSNVEKEQGALLLQGYQLTRHGANFCGIAIKDATGSSAGSPTLTTGDRITTVTLTWDQPYKNFKKAECTYVKGSGIVSLKIDGKTIK